MSLAKFKSVADWATANTQPEIGHKDRHDMIRRGWNYEEFLLGCKDRKRAPVIHKTTYDQLYFEYWNPINKQMAELFGDPMPS